MYFTQHLGDQHADRPGDADAVKATSVSEANRPGYPDSGSGGEAVDDVIVAVEDGYGPQEPNSTDDLGGDPRGVHRPVLVGNSQ